MSRDLLEVAARALRAFEASPRITVLVRESVVSVTSQGAFDRLAGLYSAATQASPVHGWWQDADSIGHTARGDVLPDLEKVGRLLEGEWTVANRTIQLRRIGAELFLSAIGELNPEDREIVDGGRHTDALAQAHQFVGRADLGASTLSVMVYSVWDDVRQQLSPVAQRLMSISAN